MTMRRGLRMTEFAGWTANKLDNGSTELILHDFKGSEVGFIVLKDTEMAGWTNNEV